MQFSDVFLIIANYAAFFTQILFKMKMNFPFIFFLIIVKIGFL